jgi:hypothetical protein
MFTTVTFAPPIIAPEESVIVPTRVPVPAVCAQTAFAISRMANDKPTRDFNIYTPLTNLVSPEETGATSITSRLRKSNKTRFARATDVPIACGRAGI